MKLLFDVMEVVLKYIWSGHKCNLMSILYCDVSCRQSSFLCL